MQIEHTAVWVNDLERMKSFYETYFNGEANDLYHNEKKILSLILLRLVLEQGWRL